MKALSIRQPWLWAILDIHEGDCPKRVENRKGTAFHYRGPVLLHASSGGTRREHTAAILAIMQDVVAMEAGGRAITLRTIDKLATVLRLTSAQVLAELDRPIAAATRAA